MPPKTNPHKTAIDAAIAQLGAKAKVMRSLQTATEPTLQTGNMRKISRAHEQLKTKLDKSFSLITQVVELKLMNDEEYDEVNLWKATHERALDTFEFCLQEYEGYFQDEEARKEKHEIEKQKPLLLIGKN